MNLDRDTAIMMSNRVGAFNALRPFGAAAEVGRTFGPGSGLELAIAGFQACVPVFERLEFLGAMSMDLSLVMRKANLTPERINSLMGVVPSTPGSRSAQLASAVWTVVSSPDSDEMSAHLRVSTSIADYTCWTIVALHRLATQQFAAPLPAVLPAEVAAYLTPEQPVLQQERSPASWHHDPTGRFELRYWDGARWTEHVSRGGSAGIDPMDLTVVSKGQHPWLRAALITQGHPLSEPACVALGEQLHPGEWVLTVQSHCYFIRIDQTMLNIPRWVLVTNRRLMAVTEVGFVRTKFRFPQWSVEECSAATWGPSRGIGPDVEVLLSVVTGNGRAMRLAVDWSGSEYERAEILCAALNQAVESVRAGQYLPMPSGIWTAHAANAPASGQLRHVSAVGQVEQVLRDRPERVILDVAERDVGRADFDSSAPGAAFVDAAMALGYRLTQREVSGVAPNMAWMGPGDRSVQLSFQLQR